MTHTQTIELTSGHVTSLDCDALERSYSVELSPHLFWRGRVIDVSWRGKDRGHTVYAVATVSGKFELRLHRLLLNASRHEIVDHIDGNGLNNTASNLRLVDTSGNAQNRRPNRGKTIKGVSRRKNGRFEAYIRSNGRKLYLGTFATEEEAAAAYDAAALEHFGEFACLNFPESL